MNIEDTVIVKYTGEVIVGIIALLTLLLRFFGKRVTIGTDAKILKCQQELVSTLHKEFDSLRKDFRSDLQRVHSRVDDANKRIDTHIENTHG